MSIKHYEHDSTTGGVMHDALKGCRMVHEEFGDKGTGKTTRANQLAEKLSHSGKQVVVVDGLWKAGQGGVRVYVKGG